MLKEIIFYSSVRPHLNLLIILKVLLKDNIERLMLKELMV